MLKKAWNWFKLSMQCLSFCASDTSPHFTTVLNQLRLLIWTSELAFLEATDSWDWSICWRSRLISMMLNVSREHSSALWMAPIKLGWKPRGDSVPHKNWSRHSLLFSARTPFEIPEHTKRNISTTEFLHKEEQFYFSQAFFLLFS